MGNLETKAKHDSAMKAVKYNKAGIPNHVRGKRTIWSETIFGFLEENRKGNLGAGNNLDDDIRQSFKKYLPIPLS